MSMMINAVFCGRRSPFHGQGYGIALAYVSVIVTIASPEKASVVAISIRKFPETQSRRSKTSRAAYRTAARDLCACIKASEVHADTDRSDEDAAFVVAAQNRAGVEQALVHQVEVGEADRR